MDPTQDFDLFSESFAADKSLNFVSGLNPTPSFPTYAGPYPVGTLDVEVPTSEILSPSPAPDPTITTVSFRVFYPCNPPKEGPKSVYWLPDPQRQYIKAYAQFLGASSHLSGFVQYLPFLQLLSWVTIPAIRNAYVRTPPKNSGRWPVMVFSHGLGGSQNAYSHLCGSLASYGLIVIAPDHRDGSAPVSFIRDAEGKIVKKVDYKPLPHTPSRKVEEARDGQLKIRLWELGMIHKILIQMDHGRQLTNFVADIGSDEQASQTLYSKGSLAEFASRFGGQFSQFPDQYKPSVTKGDLAMFKSKLDVHTPGKIAWAGHSFGAASVIQFVKTVYYSTSESKPNTYQPLYNPGKSSSLTRQITPDSPITALDLWTLPLESSATQWLWNRPLPCYAQSGPAGANLLAIISEAFFKWRGNLIQTKRILSANPAAKKPPKPKRAAPNIFYPVGSAHLSQSDFGILFPWMTKRAFGAKEPARVLRLNTRAMLQVLRNMDFQVAGHSAIDMEESKAIVPKPDLSQMVQTKKVTGNQDDKILATDGGVQGWTAVKLEADLEGIDSFLRSEKAKTPVQAVAGNEAMQNGKPGPVKAAAKKAVQPNGIDGKRILPKKAVEKSKAMTNGVKGGAGQGATKLQAKPNGVKSKGGDKVPVQAKATAKGQAKSK